MPIKTPMRKSEKPELSRDHFLLRDDVPFAMQEAYKSIRTNLQFALSTNENRCVVISSALPGEGKSTTCVNLAVAMAQTGASVVLIDADMRKSTVHRILGRSNALGLSTILGGFCKVNEGIQTAALPNLDVITSGATPPNPSELLGSDNMEKLIHALREVYDYIFIDSPPVNVVSDALVAARQAAGLVLVARQGQTTHDELRRAIVSIEFTSAKILGMILTDVKMGQGGYYKYKYKYKKHY